ncbi:MAG: glycine cleavage system protein H, partial [Ignavibacteriaceae bacterium]|nr:glycine cleavage system protein H [Ignavibacteriaceae bacterium]
KVHITHPKETTEAKTPEFLIPGGVFISEGHCWANINEEGMVKVGFDDFARKLIGKIDAIEFPNLGLSIKKGQSLFAVKQGNRRVIFNAPVSGEVKEINKLLNTDLESIEFSPCEDNWICQIDAEELDGEVSQLKIGKAAVTFYQEDIERLQTLKKKIKTASEEDIANGHLYIGEMEKLDDVSWKRYSEEFFEKR